MHPLLTEQASQALLAAGVRHLPRDPGQIGQCGGHMLGALLRLWRCGSGCWLAGATRGHGRGFLATNQG
eukprot:11879505-Alexandrium_andersonii.AAC.1